MKTAIVVLAAVAGLVLALAPAAEAAPMEFVTVGDAGNADDNHLRGGEYWGSVAYEYNIGKYEVTNAQYTVFLNAVAASDPYGLYKEEMGGTADLRGGITRTGSDGSYTYATKTNMADKPVNWVDWNNAAAFSNWLTTGDKSSGYYTMTSSGVATSNAHSHDAYAAINGLTYFIPTEDEL